MGSQGPEAMPHRPRERGIRLSDQEWSPGPQGLMSLGDTLLLAGYEVTRDVEEEEPLPPPPGPIPLDYVAPPPLPSP
eukprot:4364473-Karenia_brevis.AAC.1